MKVSELIKKGIGARHHNKLIHVWIVSRSPRLPLKINYKIRLSWKCFLIISMVGGRQYQYRLGEIKETTKCSITKLLIIIFSRLCKGSFYNIGWSFFSRFWESTSIRDELWILVWISLILGLVSCASVVQFEKIKNLRRWGKCLRYNDNNSLHTKLSGVKFLWHFSWPTWYAVAGDRNSNRHRDMWSVYNSFKRIGWQTRTYAKRRVWKTECEANRKGQLL